MGTHYTLLGLITMNKLEPGFWDVGIAKDQIGKIICSQILELSVKSPCLLGLLSPFIPSSQWYICKARKFY
jgi:hypothetical protein